MHPEVKSLEQQEVAQASVTTPYDARETNSLIGTKSSSQATQLTDLAAHDLELFHTPEPKSYTTFTVNGHRETWPLRSKMFRRWLARRYYEKNGVIPHSQAVEDALSGMEGKALFQGHQQEVFTRVAEHNRHIYLDLVNENWEAVEIAKDGWRVVTDPPVKFRRAGGMLPLPRPEPGGSIKHLRPFLNVGSDQDWILVCAWLLAALCPRGPYPILVVHGEQGSAKSSLVKALRALIDPNSAPLRAEPRELRDVMIGAANGWCLAFDNLSRVRPWLSDAMCRLSTGGGFATRELYSDQEEVLFHAQRPVMMNGIEELATRADLLDRSIILYLPAISEQQRRTETDLWQAFASERPRILGALLDGLSGALQNIETVTLDTLPRMADFAIWVTAAERALQWPNGTFMQAYAGNREAAHDLALEASPIVPAIRTILAEQHTWQGTASELWLLLVERVDDAVRKQREWPGSGQVLSNELRRLAPNLKETGVQVTFSRETARGRRRLITLEQVGISASNASEVSETQSEPVTHADAADATQSEATSSRPDSTSQNMKQSDALDTTDATKPSYFDAIEEPMEVDLRAD